MCAHPRPEKIVSMDLFIFLLLSLIFSIDAIIPSSSEKNITLAAFTKLKFPSGEFSSGSLTFDLLGGGPYAGTTDGRIFKYSMLTKSFKDFAYTSPNRTKAFCDGTNSLDTAPICGLPTGLSFDYLTDKLYSCDPFIGLTSVGVLLGGLASTLVPTKDGVPYPFLLGVDAAIDGSVYFSDASAIYGPKDIDKSIQSGDSTGRVFKYDPKSKCVTLLLSQLAGATGLATNSDASFLLVSEFTARRIRRYWLKGDKAGTSEIFLTLPGSPNKIKRNQDGDFWIGVNIRKNDSTVAPQGFKISPSGKILATVDLSKEYNRRITVVVEQAGKIFVGGLNITYIGQYDIVYV